MPKWFEEILKYNPGEKSLKAPFAIYLDLECLLKKNNLAIIIILKNHTQREKLNMSLMVEQCLQDVHLIKKKINLIITEEKIAFYCKKLKERAMKIINYEEKGMIPLTYEKRTRSMLYMRRKVLYG